MSWVLRRTNDVMRVWWPLFVSVAAVALVATLTWVTLTVLEDRRYFEEEQARDRRQDMALERVLRAQRNTDTRQADRLEAAIADVERLLADQFAEHDRNVATKLNDLLAQIAHLLGRPAGVVHDPVAARDVGPRPQAPQHASPRPPASPNPAPTTTTTTTQPGRRCGPVPVDPDCPRRR